MNERFQVGDGVAHEPSSDGSVLADEAAPGPVPADAARAIDQEVKEAAERGRQETVEALKHIKRVYVAVHGIGEQFQYETVQHVANRLGNYFNAPTPIPLGTFHSLGVKEWGFLPLTHPPYPATSQDIGLAEIYWANIPRIVQKEGYTLEEAKKWATTLVGRIRAREKGGSGAPDAVDYQMLEQVIGEMIEGVAIIDRILFLAGKMGTFKFQLKNLLDSFLGDVQVVTDFEVERIKLLGHFNSVMDRIYKANPKLDIYIVAHSEGTVVTFLSLLKAFKEYSPLRPDREEKFGWIKQVKGLMTIGSPIEEHLILWPELWKEYLAAEDPATGVKTPVCRWKPDEPGQRIKWRNYLDHGDPIAYRLSATARWIKDNRWNEVFEFEKFDPEDPDRHEIHFTRYALPGKAHGDYWNDGEVFGHFIETVVRGNRDGKFKEPPRSKPLVGFFSRVVPYLFPLGLLIAAVYIMLRAVHGYLYPTGVFDGPWGKVEVDSFQHVFWDVTAITLLLAGITIASRVPRLTRSWYAVGSAYLMFLVGILAYPLIATRDTVDFLGGVAAPGLTLLGATRLKPPYDQYYTVPRNFMR